MAKTEYSNECEKCQVYNFSPELCLDCFKKEIYKLIDEEIKSHKGMGKTGLKGFKTISENSVEALQDLKELVKGLKL